MLQTGVVDAAMLWPEAAKTFKIAEVAPYMLRADLGAVNSKTITVNKDYWDGLPDEVKGVLQDVAVAYRDHVAGIAMDRAEASRAAYVEAGGTIVDIDPAKYDTVVAGARVRPLDELSQIVASKGISIGALGLGIAQGAYDVALRHAKEREAFGKPIYKHSVWEERVARARIDIDMTRLLCLKAADMMDTVGNKAAKQEIAMIKVQAPNMALKIIDDAIQAHGGGGVSNDYGLANAYAHQRTLRLADGPDEVHARSIARMEFGKHVPQEGPTANALRGGAKAANDGSSFSSGDMGVAR